MEFYELNIITINKLPSCVIYSVLHFACNGTRIQQALVKACS